MPGLYLHIPFCRQACHYCNFHFSTSLRYLEEMVAGMLQEMRLRREEVPEGKLDTIYFGGGTPSLLSEQYLDRFFEEIYRLFRVDPDAEVTLEANPDDLNPEKLRTLRHTPVNRLSIGVQSFSETDLRFFNRAHNAIEARACIEYAQDMGFEDLTVDLIYGAPTTSDAQWELNVQTLINYDIPHLSCYALTVEPRTALAHFVEKGKAPPLDEEKSARQFEQLMSMMNSNGYEHYEISNFAKPGWHARHNSSYWRGEPYLGIGPSAHSFDGHRTRRWNVANNARYLSALKEVNHPEVLLKKQGELFEQEILTNADRYNEYVMTGLRTIWGCRLEEIHNLGEDFARHFLQKIEAFLQSGEVQLRDEAYTLTAAGRLMADRIAMELFAGG